MDTPKILVENTKTQADKIKVTNVHNKLWDSGSSDSSGLVSSIKKLPAVPAKSHISSKERNSSSTKELKPMTEEFQQGDQEGKENLIIKMVEQNPRSEPVTSFASIRDSEELVYPIHTAETLYSKDRDLNESASEKTLSEEQNILPQDSEEDQIKNKKDSGAVKDTPKKPIVGPKPVKDSTLEQAPGMKEKEEPKDTSDIAVKDPGSSNATLAEEDVKKEDMQIYFQNLMTIDSHMRISDLPDYINEDTEIIEQEKRKCWRSLLSSVSRITSFSNASSIHSSKKSNTPRILMAAILQETAKQQYKRKITLLKENYSYRMGLIKQLKHDIKTSFKSEAQQLYYNYHLTKNNNQYKPNLGTLNKSHSKMRL
ncbi:myb-like protein V [Drosophila bipectinata]|uniref:myb-like protein V n=1 Tax=Drosophila bipectinata TaxID=42026 RepID=UPI0038B27069